MYKIHCYRPTHREIGRLYLAIVVLALLTLFSPSHARAASVSCTANNPTINVGTINPYSGFPYTGSGNSALNCSNTTASAATVTACLTVGTGSGGTTPSNRTLASGANTLPIQISQSGAQVGNGASYPMAGPFVISVPVNNHTPTNIPLVITVPNPGSIAAPGSYTSSFTSTDSQFLYVVGSSPSSCPALTGSAPAAAQASFTVNATVPTQCTVTATSINFPTSSVLTSAVTANATVSTACNTSVSVTIELDHGANGTGPANRHMNSGSNTILYGIYQDAAATMPWGQTDGTNTVNIATGSGTITAYGRVPAQTSPVPGTYTDVVGITVRY